MGTKERFIYFPPPAPDAPCHVTLAGVSECDGSYAIERQHPEHSVLEYIVRGRGSLVVSETEYTPKAGDVYLLLPGAPHRYRSSADDPWVKLWFNVAGPLIPRLAELYGLAMTPLLPDCPAQELFERGLDKARQNPAEGHEALAPLFLEIIQRAASTRRRAGAVPGDAVALRLRSWLEAHWRDELGLDELCGVSGRSRAQTVRLFRQSFGVPPYRWLLRRRLAHAQALLSGSALSVRAVARESGFADEYHFAALFKRHTGLAPGRWRERGGQAPPLDPIPPRG